MIVDPGIGFGKKGEQNWATLRGLARLDRHSGTACSSARAASGSSPRRSIRMPRPRSSEERRDLATAVTSVLAAQAGAWAVRVHDVAATRDALRIAAQLGGREPMDVPTRSH